MEAEHLISAIYNKLPIAQLNDPSHFQTNKPEQKVYTHTYLLSTLLNMPALRHPTITMGQSKNLQTGPGYIDRLKEDEVVRQIREARDPKPVSKNLQGGSGYTSRVQENYSSVHVSVQKRGQSYGWGR